MLSLGLCVNPPHCFRATLGLRKAYDFAAIYRPVLVASSRALPTSRTLAASAKCVARRAIANLTGSVLSTEFFPTEADLEVRGPQQIELQEKASSFTRQHFGKSIFVRGVVEVSNYCRENCAYCGMRRENRNLNRMRARLDQLAEMLVHHCPATVTDINIQAGEDPVAVREIVIPLVKILGQNTSLGISVCLGTLPKDFYQELRASGASIYIIKFEIGKSQSYDEFEAPGSLAERLEHIQWLSLNGWNVSSGFISGLPGQTALDMLANFETARKLPLRGCSVSPFIPGQQTPLANLPPGRSDWTLNSMSILRLLKHDWVIPAVSALNLMESDGYRHGLRAGANLVTMNLSPDEVRGDYVIYKRDRFIMTEERVLSAVQAENLQISETGLAAYYRQAPFTALP